MKNHEVRRLIIESTKDTSEEKENEKVNKSIYKLEQVKLKNLRCMATSKVRKDNELDQLIR